MQPRRAIPFQPQPLSNLDGQSLPEAFQAEVLVMRDYYPFGMEMPGQVYVGAEYRYGFNGMERDDDVKGTGDSYDFGARMYDPRVGRWWSVDMKIKSYESPYASFGNSPAWLIDRDGNDTLVMHKKNLYTANGVVVSLVTFSIIENKVETKLSQIMYMGASAKFIQLKEGQDYRLTYERTMTDHPEWKNLSIFVDYPGKGIFIHPNARPSKNLGCLCVSESEPYVGEVTFKSGETDETVAFGSTTQALKSVRKLYDIFEPFLTGDKFIVRTNSNAISTFQALEPIKVSLLASVLNERMKRDQESLDMKTISQPQKDGTNEE